MRDLQKFRSIAYYLLEEGNVLKAFEIYYRLYNEIWGTFGKFKKEMNLTPAIMLNYETDEIKNIISQGKLKKILFERFRMTPEVLLNELLLITYGKLKCISYSHLAIPRLTQTQIFNDALTYYIILNNKDEITCIKQLFEFFNPINSDDVLHTIKIIRDENTVEKALVDLITTADNKGFEVAGKMLTKILYDLKFTDSKVFQHLLSIHQNIQITIQELKDFEILQEESRKQFNAHTANDKEKAAYYGKVLGLVGKIKKSEIREKYRSRILIYHPDKIPNAGKDVLKIIEQKTREINEAFDYFKNKYSL